MTSGVTHWFDLGRGIELLSGESMMVLLHMLATHEIRLLLLEMSLLLLTALQSHESRLRACTTTAPALLSASSADVIFTGVVLTGVVVEVHVEGDVIVVGVFARSGEEKCDRSLLKLAVLKVVT